MNVLDIWGIWSATLQIFVNLLDIQGLWSLNLLDIQGLWSTNHLYIRDIQARAYKAQIICIFVNIWGANLRDIWGLWRTNHLYISKSQGYSGLESPVYLQISWIFANLINICKSHKYSGPKGAQISSIFSNILDILVSPGNLESPG